MFLKRKKKFKPLYKKFIKLRENSQNRKKVFNFKKKKWKKFLLFYKLKLRWYKKFKPINQTKYVVSKYSDKHTSYKKLYKITLQSYRNFSLFLGSMKKRHIKTIVRRCKTRKIQNYKLRFMESFEKRIDVILYRAKFCHSLRAAHQLISHENVFINNKIIKNKSCITKTGDVIAINIKYLELIKSNIRQVAIWPLPPKHLIVNYNTMQIIVGNIKYTNLFTLFPFYLNIEKFFTNFNKQ